MPSLAAGCGAASSTTATDASPDAAPAPSRPAKPDPASQPDAATAPDAAPRATYLALGDSIAFGEDPNVANPMSLASFVGYPSGVAAALGLELVNAGCSGEATGGFVSATGEDNGCRPDKAKGRLHTVYTSTQLDFAIDFLKRHAGDAQPPALVTLDLGGNDLFLLQDRCNGNGLCEAGSLPAALSAMHANVQLAFASLRGTGYAGPIVFLTSYVPDFSSTLDTIGMKQTNAAIAAEVTKPAIHGLVADGYGAMEAASQPSQGDACKAGLLIALPAGGCDVHPSPAGRAILEQAVLKALGK